ncbi:MAG: alkaline phosphatase [Cyclobacteriaceae bacterium]|nr:alkaline phosphatase [Cyclobacteriaceae bacterium]
MKIILISIAVWLTLATNASLGQKRAADSPPARPRNIILMIGDGMGLTQIYAGMTANHGWLNLEKCRHIGLSKTNSARQYITDSAAGATALATGQKTYNGAVGVDTLGRAVPTILEIAERNGLATGLVATTYITDATPASFMSRQPQGEMGEEVAASFNIDSISNIQRGKIAGFVSDDRWEQRGDQLLKATKTAINILKQNSKGFFLMVEGSQIDDGGHANNTNRVIEEMLDFDKVIGEVLSFAEKDGNTLVIITADHETGGLTIVDGSLKTGRVEGRYSTKGHTSVMVPVFAFGPGADSFMGIYHNNAIFFKMMDAYGFAEKGRK